MNQLLGMRGFILITLFLPVTLFGGSKSVQQDLDSIYSLISSARFEDAKNFTLEKKEIHDPSKDSYWLAKSNYFLGYLYHDEGDFGKSIIHYLEALRYAKNSKYPNASEDVSLLYNACGIIFKRFKAHTLSEEYYLNGIESAKFADKKEIELKLNYNLAGLYRDMKDYPKAIEVLNTYLQKVEKESIQYFNFQNRLALTFFEAGEFAKAIDIHLKLSTEVSPSNFKKLGSYHHNLARSYKGLGDFVNAIDHYTKAIEFKAQLANQKDLYSSYFGLGEMHYELQDFEKANQYFNLAENLIHLQQKHPDYFELYKFCANLNYELKLYNKSKQYEDLYSKNLNEYLDIQAEIQESDQRYNMDLITQRYFSEVGKQERIANILLISKLTSGSLLTLLLLVIGYHRYQKIMLRRSIEKELIALKIVD